jgi:hypothetical protein
MKNDKSQISNGKWKMALSRLPGKGWHAPAATEVRSDLKSLTEFLTGGHHPRKD